MAGKVFIAEIKDRDRVAGTFLVQQKQIPLNRNGKPYIALVMMDRTGTMEARIWDNVDQLDPLFETGDYVELGATAVAFQGRTQLKVERLRRVEPESIDPEDFLPASTRDRGEMLGRVRELLSSIRQEDLRQFVLGCLSDDSFLESFTRAPAAKTIHHAFLGGLLEHTLAVMEAADRIAILYPTLDRDLLLTGAFFHDVGKVRELGRDRSFEYTDEGRLLGHIVMGATMIGEWAASFGHLPEDYLIRLCHMVLAHHGSYEFGSPKQPMFAEALVLNYLDDLDSKLQAFKEVAARESGQRWSSFQKSLDRYLFLGDRSPAASEERTSTPPGTGPPAPPLVPPLASPPREPPSAPGKPLELFQNLAVKNREP